MAVYYENNVMEFDVAKKRVGIEMSKGGHQLVKLESLEEGDREKIVIM